MEIRQTAVLVLQANAQCPCIKGSWNPLEFYVCSVGVSFCVPFRSAFTCSGHTRFGCSFVHKISPITRFGTQYASCLSRHVS